MKLPDQYQIPVNNEAELDATIARLKELGIRRESCEWSYEKMKRDVWRGYNYKIVFLVLGNGYSGWNNEIDEGCENGYDWGPVVPLHQFLGKPQTSKHMWLSF
jgi:hypothetical protein